METRFDNESFNDFMGIAIDTTGMPKHLQQTLNSHVCYKGGGGGQTTKTELDPDIKKAVLPAIQEISTQFTSEGAQSFAPVADQQGVKDALASQDELSKQAIKGTGVFDNQAAVNRDLQNTAGSLLAQGQGTLGSARANRARQSALADKSLQFNQQRQQQAVAGQQALTGTQQQLRALDQEQQDQAFTGQSRYFGLLGNAPQGQSQTSSGGGK